MDYSLVLSILQTATLIVAVFVAWFSIKKQRETVKKDKTIVLLMKDLEDSFLKNGLSFLRELDNKSHIEDYAKDKKKQSPDAIAIRDLLNYYEVISVGVSSDIYDVSMIKEAQRTMIVRIYEISEPFIKKSRLEDNNHNLWIKFENFITILKQN